MSLYLGTTEKLTKHLNKMDKAVYKFATLLISKMTETHQEIMKNVTQVHKDCSLTQIELKNLKKSHEMVNYQNLLLKSKESTFNDIIEKAK
jgi:hypothetical protein